MGTVHKFKRPPKNENQFKGYRPLAPVGPKRSVRRWQKLRPWQRSVIVWASLAVVAAGIVGLRMLLSRVF